MRYGWLIGVSRFHFRFLKQFLLFFSSFFIMFSHKIVKILQGKFTKFSLSEVFPSRWYQHRRITCGIINHNHRDFPSTGAKKEVLLAVVQSQRWAFRMCRHWRVRCQREPDVVIFNEEEHFSAVIHWDEIGWSLEMIRWPFCGRKGDRGLFSTQSYKILFWGQRHSIFFSGVRLQTSPGGQEMSENRDNSTFNKGVVGSTWCRNFSGRFLEKLPSTFF